MARILASIVLSIILGTMLTIAHAAPLDALLQQDPVTPEPTATTANTPTTAPTMPPTNTLPPTPTSPPTSTAAPTNTLPPADTFTAVPTAPLTNTIPPTATETLAPTATQTVAATSTAAATSTTAPTNTGVPTATASLTAPPSLTMTAAPTSTAVVAPDLTLSLTGSASGGAFGQPTITYLLTVMNIGGSASGGTWVSIPLPAGTLPSGSGQSCGFDGTSITCPVPALAPSQSASFVVAVTATGGTSFISATAMVDPTNLVGESNESNNSATASVSIAGTGFAPTATATVVNLPDLTMSLSGTAGGPNGYQQLVYYTMTVQNLGTMTSGATTVTMPVPPGAFVQSATPPCTGGGTIVSCPVPPLAPQQAVTFTASVYTAGGQMTMTLAATVDPNNAVLETNEGNNVASATISMAPLGSQYAPQPYYPSPQGYYPLSQGGYYPPQGNNFGFSSTYPQLQSYYPPPGGQATYTNSPPPGIPGSFSAPESLPAPYPYPSAPPAPDTAPIIANPLPVIPPAPDAASFAGPPPPVPSTLANTTVAQPRPSYPWLQILGPSLTYTDAMDPLWVAQPGERYYVLQTDADWALAVRDGSSTYWSVWIPLDANVQPVLLDQAPSSMVDELWLVVRAPVQTLGVDGDPRWIAEPDEWYRVVFADQDWVLAIWENDSLANPVWLPQSDAVELTLLQADGPLPQPLP